MTISKMYGTAVFQNIFFHQFRSGNFFQFHIESLIKISN